MSKREVAALQAVLSDPQNEGKPTEEVLEAAIAALDEVRARTGLPAAVGGILTDRGRSPFEAARAAFEEMEEVRRRKHRIAVVGQIQYGPQGETHTVVLGPFSAPGICDSEEKFRKVVEGNPAAREAGQGLAWDPKAGSGRGRFMLAPVFWSPRDAWEFHRPSKGELAEGPWNLRLPEEKLQAIRDSLGQWEAHITPAQPACVCGLPEKRLCTQCGGEITRKCPRHDDGGKLHVCNQAA